MHSGATYLHNTIKIKCEYLGLNTETAQCVVWSEYRLTIHTVAFGNKYQYFITE